VAEKPKTKPKKRQPGKAHPPEVQAQVMAMLLAGQGVLDVARELDLPKQTVSTIGARMARMDILRESRIETLLYEYLQENLTTLAAQSRFARTESWLKEHGPETLAVLHGVMADKTCKILAAIERARPAEELRRGAEPATA
jgi:hypothetical protein